MGGFYFTNARDKQNGEADLFGGTIGELSLIFETKHNLWLRSTISRTRLYSFLASDVKSKNASNREHRRTYSIGTFHHLEFAPELRYLNGNLYINAGLGLGYINETEKNSAEENTHYLDAWVPYVPLNIGLRFPNRNLAFITEFGCQLTFPYDKMRYTTMGFFSGSFRIGLSYRLSN